jgi:TPP-dependent pyruvate/acetoin dehydrogenase alpha subunit
MSDLIYEAKRIRMIEELIIERYPLDVFQSPVHLSIGQEAVAVGVCSAVNSEDLLYATYRSHAFYLAKGGNLRSFFAELMGKVTGCCHGKGGSMHLASKAVGFMGTSAIVGSTLPVSVGAAFALKKLNLQSIVISVFGDGATEQGVFHESVNFASLNKLPILFVMENNQFAVNTALEARQSYDMEKLIRSYGIRYKHLGESFNPEEVKNAVENVVREIRDNSNPGFIEIDTYRYLEHVGILDDHKYGHRDVNRLEVWEKNDLVRNFEYDKSRLIEIENEIIEAYNLAMSDPSPEESDLYSDLK